MSETVDAGVIKRQRRSAEEKRRIVEATMVPGASIARVAREHGVNANQLFQWRYEHRKRSSWTREGTKAELLPVTLAAETHTLSAAEVAPRAAPPLGSIHIELPGRAAISIESGVATSQIRAVLESLLR